MALGGLSGELPKVITHPVSWLLPPHPAYVTLIFLQWEPIFGWNSGFLVWAMEGMILLGQVVVSWYPHRGLNPGIPLQTGGHHLHSGTSLEPWGQA